MMKTQLSNPEAWSAIKQRFPRTAAEFDALIQRPSMRDDVTRDELYDTWCGLLDEYCRHFGHPAMGPAGGGVAHMSIPDGVAALKDALERDEPFADLDIDWLPPDALL